MKKFREETLNYLYRIRLLNPELYEKMLRKINASDEGISNIEAGNNIESSDKWNHVHYMGGKPYLGNGNTLKKEKAACSNSIRHTEKCILRKKVSVYIDAENISYKHAEKILKLASEEGDVVEKKYYDRQKDSGTAPWKEAAKEHDIKRISMYGEPEKDKIDKKIKKDIRKTIKIKTASDVICIVTSDSGYIDIIKEITKVYEMRAVVIGEKKTPEVLRIAASDFKEL